MTELPPPPEGIVLAHFIVSDDVERSRRFYTEVLGGRVAFAGAVTYVALSNSWIIINVGGGPTDDKPAVTLEAPRDPGRVSSFLNIRVKDIEAVYAEWSARGAQFLTPPKQHQYEFRCYCRSRSRLPCVSLPSARPGQKVMGHQGAASHDIAVESAAREPGVASVIRPALAMALRRVPPRYAAPTAQTGSTISAGAVVRSQVARKPAGAAPASAASLQRPAFCGHSSSATSMTTSTGHA